MPGLQNIFARHLPCGRALPSVLVTLFALGLTTPAGAQSDEHSALATQLPASTRAAGMANAYVAVRDVDVLLYNPALVGGRVGTAAGIESYGGHGSLVSVANGMTFGSTFTAGITAQLAHFNAPSNAYPIPPSALTAPGERDGTSAVIAFGAGMLYKGIRWGASAKYINEAASSDAASGEAATTVSADLGAAKDYGRFTVAIAVQDLGPSLSIGSDDVSLPTRVTLGVAGGMNNGWPIGPVDLGFTSAITVRDDAVVPAAGGEITWSPLDGIGAVGRLGVRYPDKQAGSPITFGATFFLDRLSIDYAFEGWAGSGSGHRLGVRIR